MGQQIDLNEENHEPGYSTVSSTKHHSSTVSSETKTVSIAVDTMDLESHFNCCCKFCLKQFQNVGTDTLDLRSTVPFVTMKSVSIDTSDLPYEAEYPTSSVSLHSSTNLSSKPDIWIVPFDKMNVGHHIGILDDCSAPESTNTLGPSNLDCSFNSDVTHTLVEQTNHDTLLEKHVGNHQIKDSVCESMELIHSYMDNINEYDQYSDTESHKNGNKGYNLIELTNHGKGSHHDLKSETSESLNEHLTVTMKGITVATSNIKVTGCGEERQYHCCECDSIFLQRYLIVSHLESHAGYNPFQCVFCDVNTLSEDEAYSHYKTHLRAKIIMFNGNNSNFHGNKVLENPVMHNVEEKCDKKCHTSAALDNHQSIHSTNVALCSPIPEPDSDNSYVSLAESGSLHQQQLLCPDESHSSSTKSSQIMNVETESSTRSGRSPSKEGSRKEKVDRVVRKYSCHVCNKAFRTSKALREHEVVHTGARNFPCNICGKAFGTGANMRIHRLTHSDVRPFICQMCGATFRQKDSLKVHVRKHTGERPYACNVCNMTFDRNFTLKNHMLTHASEKSFVCSVCGKSFSTRGGLNNHERLHFKDPSEPKKERRPRAKPGTGNWICDECGRIYTTRSNLKMHQRTHEPTRVSHICPVCGKLYKSRDSMEVHMRTHTEERPYKCPMCERCFYRNYTLKLHLLTHTGEKPHRCPIDGCNRSFAQTSSLSYHVRNHKKQEERSLRKFNNSQTLKKQSHSSVEGLHEKSGSDIDDALTLSVSKECESNISRIDNPLSMPLSERRGSLSETNMHDQQDMKMGMHSIVPQNIIDNINLSENQGGGRVDTILELASDINHLGHVHSLGWEDNMSLIGIMTNVHQSQPHDTIVHHSSDMSIHSQHCQQLQLIPHIPSETLPLLVSAAVPDLFHQDGTERTIGNQALLVPHLS